MRLIVISQPDFPKGEELLLLQLFEAGLQCLHLRKPDASIDQVDRLLSSIPTLFHGRIVLHDHFSLAAKYGVGGLHVNRRNPHVPPSLLSDGRSVSCSCHSISELHSKRSRFDYCFLSPVFDSISKSSYHSAFPEQVLRQAADVGTIDSRTIALGGISEQNICDVARFGFGGAAVLGNLWNRNPDGVVGHFKFLKQLCSGFH